MAATLKTAVLSGAQSLDAGFPPLAGANKAVGNQAEINQVLETLREFGRSERLTISEDTMLKKGRYFTKITLERDQQTFFYIDNFRDAKTFQLIAYSHVSQAVWQPIWKSADRDAHRGSGNATDLRPLRTLSGRIGRLSR